MALLTDCSSLSLGTVFLYSVYMKRGWESRCSWCQIRGCHAAVADDSFPPARLGILRPGFFSVVLVATPVLSVIRTKCRGKTAVGYST